MDLSRLLEKAWGQVWLLTLLWWTCAVWVVAGVKHEKHKCMLAFLGNFVVGWPLTMPLALRGGLKPLKAYWRPVLAIALLAALERTLTNTSMYSIGASLKTALHGFNVILTFFAAALIGVDPSARSCLFHGACGNNLLLVPALLLVSAGGVVTALCQQGSWSSSGPGIMLQLGSSLAYATKFAIIKLLLGSADDKEEREVPLPSKFQIAFITNPLQGLMSLAFLPFFETSWGFPPLSAVIAIGVGATGILVFELRLTELTSPLTVSVLATLHNIAIVMYFLVFAGEEMDGAQLAGFGVSSVGAFLYAWVKHQNAKQPLTNDGTANFRQPVIEQQAELRSTPA